MSETPHVLVVDDDPEIRALVSRFLDRHGYRTSGAANGGEMRARLSAERCDLVVLDIMLPGEDGLALCRHLRETSRLPIIMLTAVAEETDRIIGLEMGADDYVTKPFSPRELLARIRAVLRRTQDVLPVHATRSDEALSFAGWHMLPAKRELYSVDGALVALTAGEYDLLLAFARNAQRVMNRDQLLDLTKGRGAAPFDRSIDVQLSRLRRKIEVDPKSPELIKTIRGGGYMFTPEVEQS
ncbi:MAG: response regulator [Gammaproteobacteria bacterium]|jgi:two-component system OmpR family response regulator